MIIKVSKGTQTFEITTNSMLSFTQLLKVSEQKFGQLNKISKRVGYRHNNKTIWVTDDESLQKASKLYPNELWLVISSEGKDESHQIPHYRHYSQINVVQQDWNKDAWIDRICNARLEIKDLVKRVTPEYRPQYLDQKIISQIEANNSKVVRLGHSQDLVGSFLMSCYHQQARKKNLKEEEIDRCIWKLDEWRAQKRKQLNSSKDKKVQTEPILLLPPQKKEKYKKSSKSPSYLFNTYNQAVVMEPQSQRRMIKPLLSAQNLDFEQIKYYLFDQIHHHLTKFSMGESQKSDLDKFISKLPFQRQFTDTDLNFVTTVFQAFVEYSSKGNIYRPPRGPQSGMLSQFNDNETIAILGDWGTGQVDANHLLQEVVLKENATIVLHLGDVYYAGFPEEFERISKKINELQQQRPNLRFYTIPGNHDYYTFGGPFYEHLKDNHIRKEYNQQESFFCLRNKSQTVQFIGLNTAKNEHSMTNPIDIFFEGTTIESEEVKWAIEKINTFPGKTILLTHHMLFSAFQGILGSLSEFGLKNPQLNNKLALQLFEVFPKITCWIWGHEHRFSTYIPNAYGINRSILFGNSGFQNNQQDYHKIKYPADNITSSQFHPPRDKEGYYSHTAVLLNNFLTHKISAQYIYMSSSYKQIPSRISNPQFDQIAQPRQLQIRYKINFQMIEESGLSLAYEDDTVWLGSFPTNLQIINPQNPNAQGSVSPNQKVLIKITDASKYLYFEPSGFVKEGDYQGESQSSKKNYLWRFKRETQSNNGLQTGDIFRLEHMQSGKLIGRQKHFMIVRLKDSGNPSRFFLYKRQTTPNAQSSQSKCPFYCTLM